MCVFSAAQRCAKIQANLHRLLILIELNLFGYPSVWQDGKQISGFISEKALALFIYVAETRETHARDYLTGLLWGDTDDSKAKASLRSALYNIGKLLPDALDVTRKTVALSAEIQSSTTQLRQHNDPTVYTADFLAGFYIPDSPEFEEWQLRQREQLRLLAVTAWQKRALAAEQAGETVDAITAWRELCKLEPWREEPHRHIMRLHARQGDYAAALHQFKLCAAILEEELGVEPMAQTLRLAEQIKAARSQPRDNLPAESEPFFGRSERLSDLKSRIPTQRLITLTGIGGSGKTRLAIAVGRELNQHFLNGVGYVSLDAVRGKNAHRAVVNALISILSQADMLPQAETDKPEEWLLEQLAQREMLLILDNFEHLLDAALLLDRILTETDNIHLLITSRERLRLRQEQIISLGGLAYPDASAAESVFTTPSGQLFIAAAQRIGADVRDANAVTRICQLVDGLPLALEMAAAWTDSESAANIADSLAIDFDLLQLDERNRPNRQRSIHALFNYSWQKMSVTEQDCLRKLSVLRGFFSYAAAQTVTGATRATLARLVNKSLVQTTGDGELRQHPLLRQFSAEKLRSDDLAQPTATQQRHLDYFRAWLNDHYGGDNIAPLDVTQQVRVDFENLQAAWAFAVAQADIDALSAILPDLVRHVTRKNRYADFEEMLTAARPLFVNHSAEEWAQFLYTDAVTHFRSNRPTSGHNRAAESWRVLEAIPQPTTEVVKLQSAVANVLLISYKIKGDYPTAIQFGQRSIELHEAVGDTFGIVRPLSNLGGLYTLVRELEKAEALLKRGYALCQTNDNHDGAINFANNLGLLYLEKGEPDQASDYFQRAANEAEKWDRPLNAMVATTNLADVALRTGRYDDTFAYCRASQALMERTGDIRLNLELFAIWGAAFLRTGRNAEATEKICAGLTQALRFEHIANTLYIVLIAGELMLALDDRAGAAEVFGYVATHQGSSEWLRESAEYHLKSLPAPQVPELPLNEFIENIIKAINGAGKSPHSTMSSPH